MTNLLKIAAFAGATLIAGSSFAHTTTHHHRARGDATDAKTNELNRRQLAMMNSGSGGSMNGGGMNAAPMNAAPMSPAPMANDSGNGSMPMAAPGASTTTDATTPPPPPQ